MDEMTSSKLTQLLGSGAGERVHAGLQAQSRAGFLTPVVPNDASNTLGQSEQGCLSQTMGEFSPFEMFLPSHMNFEILY